jgi:CheY-like chemotaxis protein
MKILIIENEKPLIDLILDFFEDDHVFDYCTDLNSSLSYVNSHDPPDLIMLDLRMNGKDRNGFEVYDLVRSVWGPQVPIAIITGCDDDLLERAKDLSEVDSKLKVCRKPFGSEDLEVLFLESQSGSFEPIKLLSLDGDKEGPL